MYSWQPCFTAVGIVEEAAKNIIEYFKSNPDEYSYSLGVADCGGFCRCPDCLSKISGKVNSLGYADYSDLYFDWCNKVIEIVMKTYPDKWFGCLAYSELGDPPQKITLHPRLIPCLTFERLQWIKPEFEKADRQRTEAWAKAAQSLGWYDYLYGTPYRLPRVHFHLQNRYTMYAEKNNVKSMSAESYANWGEGPKPYITLKLWWNPDQNVDVLLKDWYIRCAGEEAAPYLEQFYAIWERFWTKDILNSGWFATKPVQYLNLFGTSYLGTVKKEDIRQSRELLNKCLLNCRTEKQKARCKIIEIQFQLYEAFTLTYLYDLAANKPITSEEDAIKILNDLEPIAKLAQNLQTLKTEITMRKHS